MKNSNNIRIRNYSDKSFAVFGNLKEYTAQLGSIGRPNRFLKDPDEKGDIRCFGYIFSNKRRDEVEKILSKELKSSSAKTTTRRKPKATADTTPKRARAAYKPAAKTVKNKAVKKAATRVVSKPATKKVAAKKVAAKSTRTKNTKTKK